MKTMMESMPQEKQYSMEELQEKYETITALYDYAEDLVSTVESDLVKNPEVQLAIVEPLIRDIGEAVDVLSEEFILIAESKKQKVQSRASKKHIEAALRKLYLAVHDYQLQVKAAGKKAVNIADNIVKKIQRQVEEIMVIFFEFIQISLQSLMNKTDLDNLRARDARVALMMHQYALGQQ